MGYMCRNIQALVNTVVLTPASCPKGVLWARENDIWCGREFAINSSQRYVFVECSRSRCETFDCRIGEVEVFL